MSYLSLLNSPACILCPPGRIPGSVLHGTGDVREPDIKELQPDIKELQRHQWSIGEAPARPKGEGEEGDVLLLTRKPLNHSHAVANLVEFSSD